MGFYVEPTGSTPLAWCKENGAKVMNVVPLDADTFELVRKQKRFILCAMDANCIGIMITPRELRRFVMEHAGTAAGFVIPEEAIFTHKPYLRDAEQEYRDLGKYDWFS